MVFIAYFGKPCTEILETNAQLQLNSIFLTLDLILKDWLVYLQTLLLLMNLTGAHRGSWNEVFDQTLLFAAIFDLSWSNIATTQELLSFNEIAAFCKSLCMIELHIFVCRAWFY